MIWLLWKLLTLPFRMGFGSVRVSFRTVRLVGLRRMFWIALGAGIGLLIAPAPGRQLRTQLRERYEQYASRGVGPGPTDVAEEVRYELAHSPRTWHLPQPDVAVSAGRVILSGAVPHEVGRQDLVKAAAAVSGVVAVDDRLVVTS